MISPAHVLVSNPQSQKAPLQKLFSTSIKIWNQHANSHQLARATITTCEGVATTATEQPSQCCDVSGNRYRSICQLEDFNHNPEICIFVVYYIEGAAKGMLSSAYYFSPQSPPSQSVHLGLESCGLALQLQVKRQGRLVAFCVRNFLSCPSRSTLTSVLSQFSCRCLCKLVQACTSTESSQASSETSYVQILTSTFIKIISVNTQPEKKNQQMPMSTLSPSKHTGMIRIRFIYLYCLAIVVDNDQSIVGLASPFSHKFVAFKLISYPIYILLLYLNRGINSRIPSIAQFMDLAFSCLVWSCEAKRKSPNKY